MPLLKGMKSGDVRFIDHDTDSRANCGEGGLDHTETGYQSLPLVPDLIANGQSKFHGLSDFQVSEKEKKEMACSSSPGISQLDQVMRKYVLRVPHIFFPIYNEKRV